MSGNYSREALAERLGSEAFALAEADAAEAPDPSPALVERLRQIFAPTIERLAERHAQPDMADAA